jgi:hypothetical protein
VSPTDARVCTGIGPFDWHRRFDPAEVEKVHVRTNSENPQETIVIEADRTLKFGSLLTDNRRQWTRAALQVVPLMPSSRKREQLLAAVGSSFHDREPLLPDAD